MIRAGGELLYSHVSRDAGDHAPPAEILAALEPGVAPIPEEVASSPVRAALGRALSRVVDPLIVPSFDRNGFRIHRLAFRAEDLDVDLSGRRCLITGANSGIGFATAISLADLGADVVLLCRDQQRGEEAVEQIRARTGSSRVSLEIVDVSDLDSVRDAAARIDSGPVDVLVHNAGVLPEIRVLTRDDLELTFATHVVGPFLLTKLLRSRLEKSDGARVVWVSSGGMYTRRLNLDDPGWSRREYDGVTAYAETKRAQVVLSELWAEALQGGPVVVNAMHPGWADTPAVRSSLPGFHRITSRILRTPAEGADTVVWLAAAAKAGEETGRFFFDREVRRTHYLPFTEESEEDRRALWDLCERLSAESAP